MIISWHQSKTYGLTIPSPSSALAGASSSPPRGGMPSCVDGFTSRRPYFAGEARSPISGQSHEIQRRRIRIFVRHASVMDDAEIDSLTERNLPLF
jgi:hypothetical protein